MALELLQPNYFSSLHYLTDSSLDLTLSPIIVTVTSSVLLTNLSRIKLLITGRTRLYLTKLEQSLTIRVLRLKGDHRMSETIKRIKGCAKVVQTALQNDSNSRNNDRSLVRLVWEGYGLILTDSQAELFFSRRLPSADTITRAARKLKQENPQLRGSARNQAIRRQNELETTQTMPSVTITPKPETKRGLFGFGKPKAPEQSSLL